MAGLSHGGAVWLIWLNGAGALVAFPGAGPFATNRRASVAASGSLSLGLFVLWSVGLAIGGAKSMAWWDFGFGWAFLALALAASGATPSAR